MKFKSVALLILLQLFSTLLCDATTPDYSLFNKKKDKKKVKPFFQFDSYYSFIGHEKADVFGFKAGVEINQKWRFGAGYNKIKSDIIEWKHLPPEEQSYSSNNIVKSQLYLNYYPVLAEYVCYNKDPWQLSIPFTVGYGTSYFSYYDKDYKTRKIFNHSIVISELGVTGQVKIFKWIGIG
ncbi:MAG: hypothetical protein ACKOX3_10415, partial [Bacteroidota bacterium]